MAKSNDLHSDEWLTTTQVSHELGVSNTRVRQLVAAGRLEVRNTPLGRLYARSSVAALIAARAAR